MTNISFITIGTELLKGRIINTNAAEAGLLLRKHGFQLARVVSIADTEEAILDALEVELERSEIILISGGLGPTKDDITKHTLAKWAQTELVWHEPTLIGLEQRYAARDRELNRLTKAQALLPERCLVVKNHQGTAPGMGFLKEGKLVVSMPGVPFEMLYMLEHEVIPLIQNQFPVGTFQHSVLRLADIPESKAAERMEKLESDLPEEIDIAYLPRADGLWLELSVRLEGDNHGRGAEILQQANKMVSSLFQDKLYTIGETPLPQLLIDYFQSKNLTLGMVEIVSGGMLSKKMYECSGVEKVVAGALHFPDQDRLTSFFEKEDWPEQEEVLAQTLARKARDLFGSDIGLATVGHPERGGDQPAVVWIGISDLHTTVVHQASFLYQRKINIDRSTHYAMQFCLKIAKERFA